MKLKTSFFDLTLFKKDITRYAPVWALYTIGQVMVLFDVFYFNDPGRSGYALNGVIVGYGVVNLIYAGICAMLLYGDLFNTRMCYSLHALPQRRETVLVSHFSAALAFSTVPTGVTILLMMPSLGEYWYLGLLWLLASQMQFVLFFGLATVSAMLTGSRFAMLVVYSLINFLSMIVLWAVETLFMPNLTGVVLDRAVFDLLCPVVYFFRLDYLMVFRKEQVFGEYGSYQINYYFDKLGEGWGYYIGIAAVGLLLMAAAIWLYRKRHLESAGDFVAFPKIKWVACVIITVCGSCVGAMIGGLFAGGMVIWMTVALVVCFFGSLMLLERRVKVFKGKRFLGLVALTAVLVCCYLASVFDVFGIRNYLPDASKVASVTLGNFMVNSGNVEQLDDMYLYNHIVAELTQQDQIEDIIEAHKEILKSPNASGSQTYRVTIRYNMKDGRKIIRTYRVSTKSNHYNIIRKYWYSTDQILGYTDWEDYVRSVDEINVDGVQIPVKELRAVMEALRMDCDAGHVVPNMEDKTAHTVQIFGQRANGDRFDRTVYVTRDALNMQKLLMDPTIVFGYPDPESMAAALDGVYANGYDIPREVWAKVADMLYQEIQAGTVVLGYVDGGTYMELQVRQGNYNMHWLSVTVTKNSQYLGPWLLEGSYME